MSRWQGSNPLHAGTDRMLHPLSFTGTVSSEGFEPATARHLMTVPLPLGYEDVKLPRLESNQAFGVQSAAPYQ